MSAATEPRTAPESVDVSLTEGVDIVWKDGHASHFPIPALRAACPCATCVDLHGSGKRHNRNEPAAPTSVAAPVLLPIFKPTGSTLTAVKPVGRYALNFIFSDGHNTGIFTWEICAALSLRGLPRGTGAPERRARALI